MPSTSTGYGKQTIYREQFSSGGQLMGFSSGCKLNFKVDSELEMESGSTFNLESGAALKAAGKIEFKSGGELELESGSTLNVEAGAFISLNSSASILYEKVTSYTTVGTVKGAIKGIPPSGFAYMNGFTTKTASNSTGFRMWLASPPKAGIRKRILLRNTTRVIEICASSSKKVEFGTSGGKDYSLVMAPTTKVKDCGLQIDLISLSSKMWHVMVGGAPIIKSTAFTHTGMVTLTSSTCKNV
jgi:hypothetical protein